MFLLPFLFLSYNVLVLSSPRPLIVDTDMDVDDMWTIVWMLKKSDFRTYWAIKAITVEGNGWSDSVFGVPNCLTLIQMLGCPNIPVAYGATTQTTLLDPSGTGLGSVPLMYKGGIDNIYSCINATYGIKPFEAQPSKYDAAELIVNIILNSPGPVDILLLGPWTNLARAISTERRIVNNIGTLYVSGGNFDNTPLQNTNYPWVNSIVNGASWNIFSDPLAAGRVLANNFNVIMMTEEAQNNLPVVTSSVYAMAAKYNVDDPFLVNLVAKLYFCTGQDESAIHYWDPSAAVWMYELEVGEQTTICTEEEQVHVWVDLNNGGGFGRSYDEPKGCPALVCRNASVAHFEEEYWSVMNEESVCPPIETTDYCSTPTIASLAEQLEELQSQIADLQTEVNNLLKNGGQMENQQTEGKNQKKKSGKMADQQTEGKNQKKKSGKMAYQQTEGKNLKKKSGRRS